MKKLLTILIDFLIIHKNYPKINEYTLIGLNLIS